MDFVSFEHENDFRQWHMALREIIMKFCMHSWKKQ